MRKDQSETGSHFDEFKTYDEVPDEIKINKHGKFIKETMFPSYFDDSVKSQLTRCLRVMPHYQNTSGFFITILEKVEEFGDEALVDPKPPKTEDKLPMTI